MPSATMGPFHQRGQAGGQLSVRSARRVSPEVGDTSPHLLGVSYPVTISMKSNYGR